MAYYIDVTLAVVDYYGENGEWLDGDRREIESPNSYTITVDPDDIASDGLLEATLDHMPKTYWLPSVSPLPTEVMEHVWLENSRTHPYTGHVYEMSVRISGEYEEYERAEIFRALTES